MTLKSKVWYPKSKARECAVLSCYALQLELQDGTTTDGYYYCGQFYHGFEKVTNEVSRWMIPYEGENVRLN